MQGGRRGKKKLPHQRQFFCQRSTAGGRNGRLCGSLWIGRQKSIGDDPGLHRNPVRSSRIQDNRWNGGRDGLACSKPLRRWGQRSGRNPNNGIVEAPVSPTVGTMVRQQPGRGVPQARPSRPPAAKKTQPEGCVFNERNPLPGFLPSASD